MKTSFTKGLRSLAVALFSLSLVSGLHAATTAEMFEGMIATAVGKATIAEKVEALNGLAVVISNIDAETAKEINPEFTSAVTAVYNEAKGRAELNQDLQKLLVNATETPVLDTAQKATIQQWNNELKGAAALTSQAKTLDTAAIQGLATVDSEALKTIGELDAETNLSKRLEATYNFIQAAQTKKFGSQVQEAFGRSVVDLFNDSTEVQSYIKQVLQEIVNNDTPLLAGAQIEYVKNEMLPRVGGEASTPDDSKADKKEDTKTGDKKSLKKGKAKKGKKAAATEDGQQDEAKSAAKKGKKAKGKKGKKGKKAAVASTETGQANADEAANKKMGASLKFSIENIKIQKHLNQCMEQKIQCRNEKI